MKDRKNSLGLLQILHSCNIKLDDQHTKYQPILDMPERVIRLIEKYSLSAHLTDVVSMCRALGMQVKRFSKGELKHSNFDQYNGVSMILDEVPYILVSRDLDMDQKCYIIAHELGHILLGHVGKYAVTIKHYGERIAPNHHWEKEADAFAHALLKVLI